MIVLRKRSCGKTAPANEMSDKNKTTRKTLQDSIRSIDLSILVDKAVAMLKEQFSNGHL